MSTVKIDLIDSGSLTENAGVVTERKRYVSVYGFTPSSSATFLDEILAVSGVPQPGSAYDVNSALVVMDRVATVNGQQDGATIELTYKQTPGVVPPSITNPTVKYQLRGSSSLQQVTTQKDRQGNAIYVTYAGSGTNQASVTQGGSIQVNLPHTSITAVYNANAHPVNVASGLSGRLNSTTWLGYPSGCWQCSLDDFSLIDPTQTPPLYGFTFRFELQEDGWQPIAAWNDPKTGQIPIDAKLSTQNGLKQISYYPVSDFNSVFAF